MLKTVWKLLKTVERWGFAGSGQKGEGRILSLLGGKKLTNKIIPRPAAQNRSTVSQGERGCAAAIGARDLRVQGAPARSPLSRAILAQNSRISALRPSSASLYSMEQSPRLPQGRISKWP